MKRLILFRLAAAAGMLAVFPIAGQDLTFAAAAGAVSPPFVITNDCVVQPAHSGLTNGGCAVYTFTLATPGDYEVRAKVFAPDEESNSFYVNIDGEPQDPEMIWDIAVTNGVAERAITWRGKGTSEAPKLGRKTFKLSSGTHQIVIRGRKGNTQLKQILLYRLPAAPTLKIVGP